MNPEFQLKLQSYLDGELSRGEARRIEQLLATDGEARLLFQELRQTKGLLATNEPELKLPESREFYWSRIERRLMSVEGQTEKISFIAWAEARLARWNRVLAPAAGVAAVALLGLLSARIYDAATSNGSARHFAEIENLSDETGSYSFRSQSENMFVVWVYNRDQETPADFDPNDDVIQ